MANPPNSPIEHLDEQQYYAKTVIVPIGRPDTATAMLELAGDLVHPTEGLVIALVVSIGDTESAVKVTDEVHNVINSFRELGEGHNVELVTELATSISRGILDVARERNAEVIILGVQQSTHRQVKLGTVVENVIRTAPCGVLIYRTSSSPAFDRVVIPIDGSIQSTAAMRLGISLALQHGANVRQMSIQYNYQYDPKHEEAMHAAEANMPSDRRPHKQIIVGHHPERNILKQLGENDLLVMGFSQKSAFERQITDNLSNQLLNHAPGPIIMISRLEWQGGVVGTIERQLSRINPQLTKVEQNELIWAAQKNAEPNLDYSMMIILAAGLATLGLLTNSVAVIIGAMLVAPLMSPLSGFSTGMATGLIGLTRRASFTLLQGVILALLISITMGVLLPIDQPTGEMLARGNPGLLDAAVALVSGLVAAYASARKGIPAALAGVAIAAALMPPICTIGLGVAFHLPNLALGASLLFLTNIIFIITAQYGIFLWLGLRPDESREGVTLNLTRVWWAVIGLVTFMVLIIFAQLSSRAVDEAAIQDRLEAEVFANARVVEYHVISSVPLEVQVVVQSENRVTPQEAEQAQALITDMLNQPVKLEILSQQLIRPSDGREDRVKTLLQDSFPTAEIYDLAVRDNEAGMSISAVIRDTNAPSVDVLKNIQTALASLVDAPVNIDITFQQMIRIESSTSGTSG